MLTHETGSYWSWELGIGVSVGEAYGWGGFGGGAAHVCALGLGKRVVDEVLMMMMKGCASCERCFIRTSCGAHHEHANAVVNVVRSFNCPVK